VLLSDRALNNQKLREVVPKAQKLKTRLLEQYTHEYKHCEEQQKLKEMRELEQEKEDKRKQHKKFKITPPVFTRAEKKDHARHILCCNASCNYRSCKESRRARNRKITLHTKTRLSLKCLHQVHPSI